MNRVLAYVSSVISKNANKPFYDRLMLERMTTKHCEIIGKTSKIQVELPLLPEWMNSGGTLHGGAISTLIDQTTTMAIAAIDERHTVSVDLSVSFIAALKDADSMQIEAICHKVGKSLAFTSAEIKANGTLIASGKHTKFMLASKWGDIKV